MNSYDYAYSPYAAPEEVLARLGLDTDDAPYHDYDAPYRRNRRHFSPTAIFLAGSFDPSTQRRQMGDVEYRVDMYTGRDRRTHIAPNRTSRTSERAHEGYAATWFALRDRRRAANSTAPRTRYTRPEMASAPYVNMQQTRNMQLRARMHRKEEGR